MIFKKSVLATLVGLAVGASVQAADVIGFDPDGPGAQGTYQVGSFDWTVGSALAVNSIAGPGVVNPDFQVLTQAVLGNLLDGNGQAISGALLPAYEITFVGGFGENAITPIPGTAIFTGVNPAYPNFFTIYFDSTPDANALAGTGYGDGVAILTGTFTSSTGAYSVGINPTGALLDQFGANNWPGTTTLVGAGGTLNDVDVNFTDSAWFKSNIASLLVDSFFNTSNVTPFNQTDPSRLVAGVAPNLGAINGATGPDFLFQSDANQSFRAVPEPGSLALLGAGLAVLGGLRSRRRRT